MTTRKPNHMTASKQRRRASQSGIALILVLWVLTLLSLIVGSFLFMTRGETRTVIARQDAAKAQALADGGVYWAIAQLLTPVFNEDGVAFALPVDGRRVSRTLASGQMVLTIQDVGGLIDVNAADDILLRSLFLSLGRDPEEAAQLADRLIDFRDLDDRPQPRGAERADYRALGLPYGPRNAPLLLASEISQIPGFDRDFVTRATNYLTAYSGSRAVDPTVAPVEILNSIPGLSKVDAEQFIASRRGSSRSLPHEATNPYLTGSPSSTFRITVNASTARGSWFQRIAVVQISGGADRFQIRHWEQGRITE
ncbi:general secretion pathway protein GspK [Iodidimonas gelatinilytica]|nr:type II secretion system protein GspK [Iodidimonas gelatinilytica]